MQIFAAAQILTAAYIKRLTKQKPNRHTNGRGREAGGEPGKLWLNYWRLFISALAVSTEVRNIED